MKLHEDVDLEQVSLISVQQFPGVNFVRIPFRRPLGRNIVQARRKELKTSIDGILLLNAPFFVKQDVIRGMIPSYILLQKMPD